VDAFLVGGFINPYGRDATHPYLGADYHLRWKHTRTQEKHARREIAEPKGQGMAIEIWTHRGQDTLELNETTLVFSRSQFSWSGGQCLGKIAFSKNFDPVIKNKWCRPHVIGCAENLDSVSGKGLGSSAVQIDIDAAGVVLNVEQPGSAIRDCDNSLQVYGVSQLGLLGSQLSNLLNSSKDRKVWPLCWQDDRSAESAAQEKGFRATAQEEFRQSGSQVFPFGRSLRPNCICFSFRLDLSISL